VQEIQTAFLFAAGYLVSRLVVRIPLAERLLYVGAKPGARLRALGVCLRILAAAAALSAVVPNVLVVLGVLPAVNRIGRDSDRESDAAWPTAKAVALLYGANIGGMASLTGTPANGAWWHGWWRPGFRVARPSPMLAGSCKGRCWQRC